MKRIRLTRGKVAVVDNTDYAFLSRRKWQYLSGYAVHAVNKGSGRGHGNHYVYMHQVVLLVPSAIMVDHRDGNTLNNQRGNLRRADSRRNAQNRRPRKHSSIYKGVSWHKPSKRWRVQSSERLINGVKKQINLGGYQKEKDAARAYDAYARAKYGEFAWLNFPDKQ